VNKLPVLDVHLYFSDGSRFERVRGGGSLQSSNTPTGPSRLETSNKYSALERR